MRLGTTQCAIALKPSKGEWVDGRTRYSRQLAADDTRRAIWQSQGLYLRRRPRRVRGFGQRQVSDCLLPLLERGSIVVEVALSRHHEFVLKFEGLARGPLRPKLFGMALTTKCQLGGRSLSKPLQRGQLIACANASLVILVCNGVAQLCWQLFFPPISTPRNGEHHAQGGQDPKLKQVALHRQGNLSGSVAVFYGDLPCPPRICGRTSYRTVPRITVGCSS